METGKQAKRIQTSILNGAEHRVLVWLAARQPAWVTSDFLTMIGTLGSVVIAIGYILSSRDIGWLWLASLGFVINWYGDSLDGNLARYRNTQRPVYGFYIDHTMDCINEFLMFGGIGLSALMRFDLAMLIFIFYLLLTLNVLTNTHLKGEFKLTYARLGPTEFRIIAIILNTCFILVRPLREFATSVTVAGNTLELKALDVAGTVILLSLAAIYFSNIISDARAYAKADPLKKNR